MTMLHVGHELPPGIDNVRQVLGVVAPESVLQNTDIVHLPSGVDGSPFDLEIAPNEAGFVPQVEPNWVIQHQRVSTPKWVRLATASIIAGHEADKNNLYHHYYDNSTVVLWLCSEFCNKSA